MYVDARARRRGIARQMLQFAEDECRRLKVFKLELSTSELQSAALALYRNAGYRLVREEFAETASNSCDTTLKNICEERGSASWNGSFLAGAPPYGA